MALSFQAGRLVVLALALIATLLHLAWGQEARKVARIGMLDEVGPRATPWRVAFERRLAELGYVDGKTLVIEFRTAGGHLDRLPGLAAELVRLKPDVILASGPDATRTLKQATTTIPVVFNAIEWDPVSVGVVASLARPASNFTGVSALAVELAAKRFDLLRACAPGIRRVAVLWHRPRATDQFRIVQEAAQAMKLTIVSLDVGTLPHDLEGAFKTAGREHADAILILGSPAFFPERKRLADLALRYRLPASFQRPAYAEAGGLMSFGPDIDDIMRRMAEYADRILKGAAPAELPVEQPSRFELVVNMKTARALGLAVPGSILLQAARVIE